MTRLTLCTAALAICLSFGAHQAHAIPILQLYLEGGTYDTETETWVISPHESSGHETFRLWAIGNICGPGGRGTINNVRLSAAYGREHLGLDISLTPSQAGGFGVGQYVDMLTLPFFTDPSVPQTPVLNTTVQTSLGIVTTGPDGVVTNGGVPVLGDGRNLPPHGIFGPDTVWQEYSLGDFDTPDSPVADFVGSFPTVFHPCGQINVYDVCISGGSGVTVHFDLYGTLVGKNRAVFAPFSHDAEVEASHCPEPASLAVWSLLGLIGIAATRQRRRGR